MTATKEEQTRLLELWQKVERNEFPNDGTKTFQKLLKGYQDLHKELPDTMKQANKKTLFKDNAVSTLGMALCALRSDIRPEFIKTYTTDIYNMVNDMFNGDSDPVNTYNEICTLANKKAGKTPRLIINRLIATAHPGKVTTFCTYNGNPDHRDFVTLDKMMQTKFPSYADYRTKGKQNWLSLNMAFVQFCRDNLKSVAADKDFDFKVSQWAWMLWDLLKKQEPELIEQALGRKKAKKEVKP